MLHYCYLFDLFAENSRQVVGFTSAWRLHAIAGHSMAA
jgi:hypothetical protein